jgi:hypothetical protein
MRTEQREGWEMPDEVRGGSFQTEVKSGAAKAGVSRTSEATGESRDKS